MIKNLLVRHFIIFIGLLFVLLMVSGPYLDSICVEGRISRKQAAAINANGWNKCPKYRNGNCQAEKKDRILIWECSELSRKILLRDHVNEAIKWWKAQRVTFQ